MEQPKDKKRAVDAERRAAMEECRRFLQEIDARFPATSAVYQPLECGAAFVSRTLRERFAAVSRAR